MKYVIRLTDKGYFSQNHPWSAVHISKATYFDTMKEARRNLNRLRDGLGFSQAEIETL